MRPSLPSRVPADSGARVAEIWRDSRCALPGVIAARELPEPTPTPGPGAAGPTRNPSLPSARSARVPGPARWDPGPDPRPRDQLGPGAGTAPEAVPGPRTLGPTPFSVSLSSPPGQQPAGSGPHPVLARAPPTRQRPPTPQPERRPLEPPFPGWCALCRPGRGDTSGTDVDTEPQLSLSHTHTHTHTHTRARG